MLEQSLTTIPGNLKIVSWRAMKAVECVDEPDLAYRPVNQSLQIDRKVNREIVTHGHLGWQASTERTVREAATMGEVGEGIDEPVAPPPMEPPLTP